MLNKILCGFCYAALLLVGVMLMSCGDDNHYHITNPVVEHCIHDCHDNGNCKGHVDCQHEHDEDDD